MGNRLFHYHFLRQVSKKTGIEYFHPDLPDKKYFNNMEKKSRPFSIFKKQTKLNSKKILSYTPEDFLGLIASEDRQGKDLVLNPPMLGEVFFDYLFYPTSEFINIKDEYKKPFNSEYSEDTIIGLHFRGTDFEQWNHNASLKFSYYRDAINHCLDYYKGGNIIFMLFTDDNKFPPFLETTNHLKMNGLNFHISTNISSPIIDFYQMSRCDVLISSPSTFAIFAGAIGKEKKIIHNKAWLDYAIAQNDTFWVRLAETTNSYYSLWKTF